MDVLAASAFSLNSLFFLFSLKLNMALNLINTTQCGFWPLHTVTA